MLPREWATEDAVPDWAKGHVKRDTVTGKFNLEVEGMVPGSELETFRTENRDLKKTNETLTQSVEERKDWVRLEEHQNVLDQLKQAPNGEEIADLRERLKTADTKLSEVTNTSAALAKERDSALGAVNRMTIDSAVDVAGRTAKVQSTALTDLKLRASQEFAVVDGEVYAVDKHGEVRHSAKDPTKRMSPDIWIDEHVKPDAPHFFEQSKGMSLNPGSVIPEGDLDAFANNLDGIAKGEIEVLQDGQGTL